MSQLLETASSRDIIHNTKESFIGWWKGLVSVQFWHDCQLHEGGADMILHPLCRVRTDKEFCEIELNDEGFPLTAVEWPEGSLDDFPAVLDVKDWEGELPANINPPILVHGLNVRPQIFL